MSEDTWVRLTLGLLFIAVAAMSLHYRLKADRAGGRVHEQPRNAASQFFVLIGRVVLPPALVLSIVGPPWMGWASFSLPMPARWGALAIAAICMAGLWWMFVHLDRNITPTAEVRPGATLVTTGPYRYIRHPLYVFAFAWLAAAAIAAESWLLLAVAAGAFTFVAVRAKREEANLAARYGEEYRRYQQRTGRFLPRL